MISEHRGQHSWAERLADLTVIGCTDKPGKAEALASAQAAAVTTDLAEISTALRDTPCICHRASVTDLVIRQQMCDTSPTGDVRHMA
jgi:hypothetical protein